MYGHEIDDGNFHLIRIPSFVYFRQGFYSVANHSSSGSFVKYYCSAVVVSITRTTRQIRENQMPTTAGVLLILISSIELSQEEEGGVA